MKNFKNILLLTLTGFSINLLFMNCSKSGISGNNEPGLNKSDSADESSESPPIEQAKKFDLECLPKTTTKHFSIKSLSLSDSKTSEELKTNGVQIGQELSVTLDLNCINNQANLGIFSNHFKDTIKSLSDTRRSSATFHLINPYDLTPEQFNSEIIEDHCLIAIFPNTKLNLLATTEPVNDPSYINQSHLTAIHHRDIYNQIFNPNNGITQTVKVAVIDTGIDLNHPDLRPNLILDSSNQVLGLNAIDNNNLVQDALFHGTHVSGIIGAVSNNSIGISGVLGKNIKIIPIKVSANGVNINSSATVNGIRWAADQGVDVINMSLGGPNPNEDMRLAIEYAISKGVLVVVAAGNDGKQLSDTFSVYPAKWGKDFSGMLTVGSIDATSLLKSSFSNYSPTYVEIMSPGSNGNLGILSTIPTNLSSTGYASTITQSGKTSPIHGTSMATPVVTGAGALLSALAKSRGYRPQPDQLESLIKKGAATLAGFSTYVENSQSLDLKSLVDAADLDMGLSSLSTENRFNGKGVIKISQQPRAQSVLYKEPILLNVELSKDSSILINFQWFKNGKAILGATKQSLLINEANSLSGGSYSVELQAGTTVLKSEAIEVLTAPIYCN